MSSRMNGYSSDRERRPPSEQMSDLHIYLVPPEIWREKYHNALNQNINETVSIGFIRVHPETKLYALRDEIEQQLGTELVPREYVFVKSVGRSLTRVKARQEATLKVKNFLPPQAYAPELYLLEATPEVQQQIAASSENSTRPETRTSYDYEFMHRQNPPQHRLASSPRRQQQPGSQEAYLQPLSATPPHTDSENDKNSKNRHGNLGSNQNKHDEDSGIAGFTPDTYRENEPLDRRKNAGDESDRLKAPSPDAYESDRLGQSRNDNDNSDWERQRKEEQDRLKREEEERRRREEEENRRNEQDREEQNRLMKSDSDQFLTKGDNEPVREMTLPIIPKETSNVVNNVSVTSKENSNISKNELTKYPSPPPLRLASPDRDTASARERRKRQKEELLRELDEARDARRAAERQREELVKHAKQMQTKTQNKRNHARDLWKKRYFEEKKKTGPLEEQCNRLRHELDIIHKKLLTTLEGPKEKATKLNDIKPSNKVGSPGRPVVSSAFQTSRTPSPRLSPTPKARGDNSRLLNSKGDNSDRQASPTGAVVSSDPFIGESSNNNFSPRMSPRVVSPRRGQDISLNLRNVSLARDPKSQSFRERPTPRQGWAEVNSSPRQPVQRGRAQVVTNSGLDRFKSRFHQAKKEHKQYPLSLVGSDQKQAYFDSDQFDSDYDSKQSSARSILAPKSPDRYNAYPRKNVQFDI
ncbi:spermatogenesis-associated protein 1-like isoform X6 [Ruditapes philippinarum]|uniref:spermatogenesis-associated protein 1-like isoform X6 n=1 Tax=Ruditapes philippinarum TaxID=129788 RepID=UPI00295AED94|nr:spermatogenesis-associated protein 1-like isoform X6 [Ruditapes philippinarum]